MWAHTKKGIERERARKGSACKNLFTLISFVLCHDNLHVKLSKFEKSDNFNGSKKQERMKHTLHCTIQNDSWTKKGGIAQINCKKWLSILGINFTFVRRLLNASMQIKWKIWKLPESVRWTVSVCVLHYSFSFTFAGKSFYEGNLVYFLSLFFPCKIVCMVCGRWACVCECVRCACVYKCATWMKGKRWKHTYSQSYYTRSHRVINNHSLPWLHGWNVFCLPYGAQYEQMST